MDSSVEGSCPLRLLPFEVESSSGQVVNEWSALRQATVLQCITILMNGVSAIPFRLMKEKDKTRSVADGHPLYYLFKEKPNPWQSSVEFWNMIMVHLALQGEIVVWKVKARNQIKFLVPFAPGRFHVTQKYEGGWAVKTYQLTKDDGSVVTVPEEEIWHLRWREYGLRAGLPQMALAREVVGVALAGDNQAGSSFKNRSAQTGIIHAKAAMNQQQKEAFMTDWEKAYGGAENSGKNIFLGADVSFTPTTMSNQESQFIEQRKFQIEEICRCWNVNPMMVFSNDGNSSYNSNEQSMLQHVVHTMAPWYRLIEESAYVNLLSETERRKDGLYFAFNDNALLRSDSAARGALYRTMFSIGAMTPNEIREKEDLPPKEGGDKLLVQGATVPLVDAGKWNNPQTEGAQPKPSSDSENEKEPEE